MNELTSRQRIDLYFKGQQVDRLPCVPFLGESSSKIFGITPSQHNKSAELMAFMEIESYKTFKHDGCSIGTGVRAIAEAMGAKVEYPATSLPFIKEPLLKDYRDLKSLKIIDPFKDGRLGIILQALSIADKAIGKEVEIVSDIAGPVTIALIIRGFKNFINDINNDRENLKKLLEVIAENNIKFIDAVAQLGFNIGIADPVSSGNVISQKQFREISRPYLHMCAERIKEKTGRYGYIHICGKSKELWTDLCDMGFSALSIDGGEDLMEASKMVGNKMCIMGNVPPVEVLKNGDVEDVHRCVEECVIKGIDNPSGYILSSGCDVPMGTDIKNIHAMMKAAEKYYKKYRK